MKIKLILGMTAVVAMTACGTAQKKNTELVTANDSLSYAIGMSIADNFKNQGLDDVNIDAIHQAMKDDQDGVLDWTLEEANAFIQTELQKKQESKDAEAKQGGVDYLEQNKAKEGVQITASGLQYEVLVEGTGATPDANDEVTVHYTGTLIDGTVFDSSVERGTPATFGVNRVIPGWTEGLQLMKEGGKMRFVIPQELAYGGRQAPGGTIPAFSTLIFEVELISVKVNE